MMNPDTFKLQLNHIVNFKNYREIPYLEEELVHSWENNNLSYMQNLMLIPVSSMSSFGSAVWDFNADADAGNVSINCRGASLRINWDSFENIPKFVITEIKCITYLYKLNPKLFINKDKNGKHVKANTLVKVTRDGLRFINHVFMLLNDKYGIDYIHKSFSSLAQLEKGMFEEAASTFEYTYHSDLKTFIDNLRHPFAKNVVGEIVDCKDPKTLPWKNRSNNGVRDAKIIPEQSFDKLVHYASFLVTDFLVTMGAEPTDKVAIKHLSIKSDSVKLFSELGFTKHIFDVYAASRLQLAGYDDEIINKMLPDLGINNHFKGRSGNLVPSYATKNSILFNKTGNTFADVLKITNLIKYAAEYLISQFTGMRPSEIASIPLDCIVEENNIHLIKSKVTKGRSSAIKDLFDDKWVAIPAIIDAVKCIQILNVIYQSDKLFSNVETKSINEDTKYLTSQSFKSQINNFIAYILGEEIASEIGFYPYMTRHTLAYHLFRADLGLPFISYQLKHLVQDAERYTSRGMHSGITLSYGHIGDELAKGTRGLRRQAEIEKVKSTMDPDGIYLGPKGIEHKQKLQNLFTGYMAEGYDKEDVFVAMVEQGIALVNMGTGFCYGGRTEDFDESIPCIGTLRCNPIRCKNAIVTKANAPKWREVYVENMQNLNKPEYACSSKQIQEAINEAKQVLEYLGEPMI